MLTRAHLSAMRFTSAVIFLTGPSYPFAVTVLIAKGSGNDKAPFLVLSVLGLCLLVLMASLAVAFFRAPASGSRRNVWFLVAGTAAPLVYAGVSVLLANLGLIDLRSVLGFN